MVTISFDQKCFCCGGKIEGDKFLIYPGAVSDSGKPEKGCLFCLCETEHGDVIYQEDAFCCDNCGETNHNDDSFNCSYCDRTMCEGCYNDHECENRAECDHCGDSYDIEDKWTCEYCDTEVCSDGCLREHDCSNSKTCEECGERAGNDEFEDDSKICKACIEDMKKESNRDLFTE